MKFGLTTFTGRVALIGGAALALAACGDSDNASDEVVADNVEIPADNALDEADEGPVADPVVAPAPPPAPAGPTAEERRAAEREQTEDAAARAEEAAADIQAEIEAMQNESAQGDN